ncbi:hypothetical protein 2209_scaffold1451_00022 [Bacteriophage sp.]|nr:hypothetical protein 2209_scaffold1451_00022 [Bacteriophage sp.]
MPLGDFDRLARHVGAADGDEALRLLRFLALFGVVRHLQVEPCAARVGNEHIVQHGTEQLNDLDLDAQHDHEHRVEHAARMEVADDEALVLQLLDLLLLQLVQRGQRENGVQYFFVDHSDTTSTLTAPMMTSSSRRSSSSAKRKEQCSTTASSSNAMLISMLSGRMTSRFCSLSRTRWVISRRVSSVSSDWMKSYRPQPNSAS